jgi:serine protease Do
MKAIRGDIVAGVLAVVVFGGAAAWLLSARASSPLEKTLATAAAQELPGSIDASRRTALVVAAERAGPSVVSVNVVATQLVRERGPGGVLNDPFFERLFPPRYRQRQVESLGSGFIVSADGYILTNDHVVHRATDIVVTLLDGRQFPARLVGTDPATDLAVLKVDAEDLPVAPLGDSDDLLIGEWAIAIGNPFGYLLADPNPSVTAGVISAVGRDVRPDPAVSRGQPQVWSNMIQTDAAINPGNSGGPLVNARGEVIGVNAFIFSGGTGGSIGLGFAIPINRARRVLSDVVRFGEIRHPWVGVHLAAGQGDGPVPIGAFVRRVDPGSPAEGAGIAPGDRIVAVDGRPLHGPIEWEGRLLDQPSEEPFTVTLERGGARVDVTLTPRDDPLRSAERIGTPLGADLVVVDATLASYLGLRYGYGLYLAGLEIDAPLRGMGLATGDVLLQLDDRRLDATDDVEVLIDVLRSGRPFVLLYESDGMPHQYCYRVLC